MATKELFLKDRKLASDWRGIAGGNTFETVLTYARAMIVEGAPSRDELRGVELLAHTLTTMAEPNEVPFNFPSPGLHHDVDAMPEATGEPKNKAKRK